MRIRTRLVAGLAALLLVPAVLGSGALFYLLHRTLSVLDQVVETSGRMHDALQLQNLISAAAMPPNDYLIHGSVEERENFARLSRELNETFDQATAAPFPERERGQLRESREEWRKAETIARALLALPRPVGNPAAARDMERLDAHIERAADLVGRVHRRLHDKAGQIASRARTLERRAIAFAAGIFAVAGAIAAAVALWLARSFLEPLQRLEGAAVRFGAGDLAHRAVLRSDDELGRLAGTFNAMAQALEQNRAALERRAGRLAALNWVAVALTSSFLCMKDLLDQIMRSGADLTGAKAACIAFYDEGTGRFTEWVTHGLSEHFVKNMSFRPGGLADEAFATAGHILSNDRPETKHKLSKLTREEGLKSFVCLPLTSHDRRLGVVYFYRTDRDEFTPGEIEVLATFAALAAQAIENARRYGEMAQQARTDALTGLDNRRELERRLGEEIERAQRHDHPAALLMLDLDHFKAVNDTCGHLAGDDVLRAVAARLRAQVRPTDHAARYGGEEFAAILPETPAEGARVVAERMRRAVAGAPFRLADGREIALTVSIGVACYPDDAGSHQEIVERADQALYIAKQAGRDRVMLYGETLKAQIEKDPARIVALLNESLDNIGPLVAAVSSKAAFFRGHTDVVERAVARLAAALALPEADVAALGLAARLHDLGMAAIPDAVLNKMTALSPEDEEVLRRHPVLAAQWLEQVPALAHLAPIVRHHHERWDGGGYPDGLKGEATPLLARALAVADAYGAMVSDWPGHPAMAPEEAEAALRAGAGTQLDPQLVEAALGVPDGMAAVVRRHGR